MQGRRSERVGDVLKEEISLAVQREIKDPRIGFVTITGVKVTDDLHNATVYYTVVGDAEQHRRTQEGLDSAAPFLRRLLGRRLRLRYSPILTFRYDVSLDQGLEVDALIEKIRHEEPDPHPGKG